MFRGFPEVLKGDALLWLRNEIRSINNYTELLNSFKTYYLSSRELRNLEKQILGRKQKIGEDFKTFSRDLRTLIRRHGEYNAEKELDMLYWNILPKYRLHIRQNEVTTVNELFQRIDEICRTYKEIEDQKKNPNKHKAKSVNEVQMKFNPKTDCWKCGQSGHMKFQCNNKTIKFCSFCGKLGVWPKYCNSVKPENSKKTESTE